MSSNPWMYFRRTKPFWKYNLHLLSSLTKTGEVKGPGPAPSPVHFRTKCSDGMVNDVEERPIVPAITVLKNDHYFSVLYPLSAETSGALSDIFL